MKGGLIIIILIATLLNSSCQYASQIGPFYLTQPVMLGKTQNIGGTIIIAGKQKHDFDISECHGKFGMGVIGGGGDIGWEHRENVGDLGMVIDGPDDLVKVDNVYFRTSLVVLPITVLLVIDWRITTGVRGTVYENIRGKESIDKIGIPIHSKENMQ